MSECLSIARALVSVSDKTGLADLGRALTAAGIETFASGGTHAALAEAGAAVVEVAEVTGFPEIMDGRIKTLHPMIHGGILARRDTDGDAMSRHGIRPIDLVVANLYPFERTVARADVTVELAIENIDIGGPTLLRSAAKNHAWVTVVVDPADYPALIARLGNGTDLAWRRRLALKAFTHTAGYDAAIATYFARLTGPGHGP